MGDGKAIRDISYTTAFFTLTPGHLRLEIKILYYCSL